MSHIGHLGFFHFSWPFKYIPLCLQSGATYRSEFLCGNKEMNGDNFNIQVLAEKGLVQKL
jgi:hypothetical protein